jgi:hypothetical protein
MALDPITLYTADGEKVILAGLAAFTGGNPGLDSVTDGTTTVAPATSIDFTSGATVTDGGSGVAQVAVGGGVAGSVFAEISGTSLGSVGETPEVDFATTAFVAVTTVPLVVAAMSEVAGAGVTLANVPDIGDTLDVIVRFYVTDQLGTNTGLVTVTTSTPTPAGSFAVDFTGSTATIVGADLTWNDGGASFSSTAGGVFSAILLVQTGPD